MSRVDMGNLGTNNVYELFRRRPIVGPLNIYSFIALTGILGPIVLIICDYTPALTTPGYNFIRDSISSLAWTPMGWLQSIGFLAIGLLMEIYFIGLLYNIHPRRGFRSSVALFVFFGFGLLMMGAFHTNAVGAAATVDGTIHGIASKTVFVIFPIAALLTSFSIRHDPRWRHLYLYTVITVIFGFILIVAVLLANDTNWFGLVERLLVWNMIFWVDVTAIRLLLLSLRREQKTAWVSATLKPGA